MRPTSTLASQHIAQVTSEISPPGKTPPRSDPKSCAHEKAYSFIQNDVFSFLSSVQPEQFSADQRNVLRRTGEYRLLVAVLQDALECWFRYRNTRRIRGQRLFQEIEAWFLSRERNWLFAFECICDHLALDPDYIRRGLLRWQASPPIHATPRFHLTPVLKNRSRLEYED